MTWWWVVPVGAMAIGAIAAAIGGRRLGAEAAGLADDAAALAAAGAGAAAVVHDIAAVADRVDRGGGTGRAPGAR